MNVNLSDHLEAGDVLRKYEFAKQVLDYFGMFGQLGPSDLMFRLTEDRKDLMFLVNCSDVFWWGTADCEQLTPENFPRLQQAVEDTRAKSKEEEHYHYMTSAPLLFVARERKMRPQGAYYNRIHPPHWPLFDACGPARDKDVGNPYLRPELSTTAT
jgi:hypothetical protein